MRTHVIACGVLRQELTELAGEGVSCTFLEQGLHLRPELLAGRLQAAIHAVAGRRLDRVVLGYGRCADALVGLRAGQHPLVIPRSHDCLGLLWGDVAGFEADRARQPGTYYLSKGWLEGGAAPLDKLAAYRRVMDPELAEWGLREEFRHYTRLVWVDTGHDHGGVGCRAARRSADFLGLQFEVVRGSSGLLAKILRQPPGPECVVVSPGQRVEVAHLG